MIKPITAIAAIALLSASAFAQEQPDIRPGMWEYTNKVSFSGDMPIEDQESTSQDCVTPEDIKEGGAFMEDTEECEITDKDIRSDGMTYSMTCSQGGGMNMKMDAEMSFDGDSVEGVINGNMDSPMGKMEMRIDMSGKRVGDC